MNIYIYYNSSGRRQILYLTAFPVCIGFWHVAAVYSDHLLDILVRGQEKGGAYIFHNIVGDAGKFTAQNDCMCVSPMDS